MHADHLFTGHTGLGLAFEGGGDLLSAAEHYRKAVKLTEELRSGLTSHQRERFFDVKVDGFYRTTPYEGLARTLMRLNKPIDAWNISEYTKARLFAEAISRGAQWTRADVPEIVLKTDEELFHQLVALKKQQQKAYEKNDTEKIAVLEPQVKDLEDRFAAHKNMLREQYPLFAATKYPEPMEMAQTALRDDEWVLAYDVGEPGLIVYSEQGENTEEGHIQTDSQERADRFGQSVPGTVGHEIRRGNRGKTQPI